MTMRRIVVVGNGIAGLTACDSLRSAGFDGELTVVGAERHHPYSRPALSKALLHGVDGSGNAGNSDDGLQAHELPEPTHEATELLGVSVSGLDVDARVVRLDGGGELPYDGLVIASGSRAKRLAPTEGAREPRDDGFARELTLRTIEDAITLKQRVAGRPSVIVVGGGPLGMEVGVRAACRLAAKSRSSPTPSPSRASWAGICPGCSPPPLSGADCGSLAAGRRVSSTPVPGRGSPWPTALNWRQTSSSPPSATSQTSAGWPAPNSWSTGRCGWTPAAGSGRRSLPPATWRPSRRAAGCNACPLWTSAIDQAKVAAVGLLQGDAAPELNFQPYFWTEGFGLSLKSVGFTPVVGAPDYCEPGKDPESMLLRWENRDGSGTAAAVNYRIPIPKLRRLADVGPGALRPAAPANV